MKLLGSIASPFVRRLRMQLMDQEYEFETVNVFSEEGQKSILKYSPTLRVPIFVDGENIGQIDIDSHTANPFTKEDESLLEFVCEKVATLIETT